MRFFPWVWASVLGLLASGYGMVLFGFGGFASAGVHVHVMHALGLVMVALFLHLYFAPWRRFRRALDGAMGRPRVSSARSGPSSWSTSVLGLITAAIGASGRYWG